MVTLTAATWSARTLLTCHLGWVMNEDVPNGVSRTKAMIVWAIPAILIIAFLGLTGTYTEIWDGGYPYFVCELTFVDETGDPIEGVELQVERRSGAVRYHWPVDDFYLGRIPTSDETGLLRFHCCGHRFGGTYHCYFHVIRVGDHSAPEYDCRFFYHGEEIHNIPFNDLAFPYNDRELPRIKRSIRIPTADQIFDGSIPPTSDLPETEHEFMLVQRTVTVET